MNKGKFKVNLDTKKGKGFHEVYLLPEFLDRIGMSPFGRSSLMRELQARYLVRRLPASWLPTLKGISANRQVRGTRRALGGLRKQLESPRTKAAAFENNRCGAIRLNIKGREPYGRIDPSEEAADVIRVRGLADRLAAVRLLARGLRGRQRDVETLAALVVPTSGPALQSAAERLRRRFGRYPRQLLADGAYTNHDSVPAIEDKGIDYYSTWTGRNEAEGGRRASRSFAVS